jgi:Na+/H+ antiporter NhaD/arsenite permease-like protein
MLLIRPFLKTNSERTRVAHLPIFFIFLVSNIGGSLTPLGDPPLFLGYLRGVPFRWTFSLLPEWLFMLAVLLAVFFVLDTVVVRKEAPEAIREDRAHVTPLHVRGARNLLFLAGVVVAVFLPLPWRVLVMAGLAAGSYASTPRSIHLANRFSFFPINEVAILFAGIFICVVPALVLLEANGASLGVTQPWQYFWLTGLLSSFLDNAPTYLTFTSLALGQLGLPGTGSQPLLALSHHPGTPPPRGDQLGGRVHGSEHVHREWTELHGQGNRRGEASPHARVLRLHRMGGGFPAPSVRSRDMDLPRVAAR